MTEKQRWLLHDLDLWRERQMERIGRYGPSPEPKEPPHVREARKAVKQAEVVIRQWEKDKKAPWNKLSADITKQVQTVKRIILFEKTADALKAIKALK